MDSGFDDSLIPFVTYTDPKVARVGMAKAQTRESNVRYEKGIFPGWQVGVH